MSDGTLTGAELVEHHQKHPHAKDGKFRQAQHTAGEEIPVGGHLPESVSPVENQFIRPGRVFSPFPAYDGRKSADDRMHALSNPDLTAEEIESAVSRELNRKDVYNRPRVRFMATELPNTGAGTLAKLVDDVHAGPGILEKVIRHPNVSTDSVEGVAERADKEYWEYIGKAMEKPAEDLQSIAACYGHAYNQLVLARDSALILQHRTQDPHWDAEAQRYSQLIEPIERYAFH
ncbi:hypothetical protein [Leifsonia sp. Leaf264]|uniref:hypothetical protein n=1 Tax=Leifsonia sp. Leaf264 TaxID=1736314 RepID=UPI0006F6271E|nr:hypothetical protein [Leifsonia sp. Leaf264]KQO98823.1 hypothetical protein ASF30_12230 [Leifsonia sp. Leaf264]